MAHEVINHSHQLRVVLIFDVPRPLPRLPRFVNDVVLWKLAAPSYAGKVIDEADNYSGDLM